MKKNGMIELVVSLLVILVIASCASAPAPDAVEEPAPAAEQPAEEEEAPVAEEQAEEESAEEPESSSVEEAPVVAAAEPAVVEVSRARMEVQELFARLEAYDNIDLTITEVGVDIAISRAFAANSTTVSDQLAEQLDLVGQVLSLGTLDSIVIEGHVAEAGDPALSIPISEGRAENVARYLEINYGIPRAKIQTIGRGGAFPIADNSSPIGRARNRRVVVLISGSIE